MGEAMTWLQAIVLGAVQGLTEFLPISSSGHLRIVSEIFFGDDAGASFTAVTQLGTEAAVLIYFARDIGRIIAAWFRGLLHPEHRGDLDYRMGWYVIIGTIPVGVLGFLFKDQIRTGARNLWLIATMLIVFAFVIAAAEYYGRKVRPVEDLRAKDGIIMGSAQALALIPGCLAVGRHDQRRPLPRTHPRSRGALLVPPRHPRGRRIRAVQPPGRIRTGR